MYVTGYFIGGQLSDTVVYHVKQCGGDIWEWWYILSYIDKINEEARYEGLKEKLLADVKVDIK